MNDKKNNFCFYPLLQKFTHPGDSNLYSHNTDGRKIPLSMFSGVKIFSSNKKGNKSSSSFFLAITIGMYTTIYLFSPLFLPIHLPAFPHSSFFLICTPFTQWLNLTPLSNTK